MKTLSIKLPEPLAVQLSRRSRELGRTQAGFVRAVLERELHSKKKTRHSSPSPLETADSDILKGRVKRFGSVEEMISNLKGSRG